MSPALCDAEIAAPYRARRAMFWARTTGRHRAFLAIARLLYDGPWVAERTAALRDVIETAGHPASGHARHPGSRPHPRHGRRVRRLSPACRRPAARQSALFADLRRAVAADRPVLPDAGRGGTPIRSASTAGSARSPTSSISAIWPASPCPPASAPMACRSGVTLLGPAWSEGRLAALADALHRAARRHRRHGTDAATAGRTRCARRRRDGAVLHRRAHVRPAAEPPAHDAGRPVCCALRNGAAATGCIALGNPARACCARTMARRSRAKSGRCRPPPSARCWRRCRRRSASAPYAGRWPVPGVSGRGRRRRGRARHHHLGGWRAWLASGDRG